MRIANRAIRHKRGRANVAARAMLKAAGILALIVLTAAAGIAAAYVGVNLGQRAEQTAAAPEIVNPNHAIWI